jgi:hypothetical protein
LSLKTKVNRKIRNHHPGVYEPLIVKWYRTITAYANSPKGWQISILFVAIAYGIGLLAPPSALEIIELNTVDSLIIIDQRTANIAFGMSITLIVAGLILNNLGRKEPFIYHVLYKASGLYVVVYFTITVLASLFMFSTLRSTIPNYIPQIAVIGTYLAIFILILVGFLFSHLIKFSDRRYINQKIKEEVISQAKKQINQDLLKKYSLSIFAQNMKAISIPKLSSILELSDLSVSSVGFNDENTPIQENGYLHDIKFHPLLSCLSKKSNNNNVNTLRYQESSLGGLVSKDWKPIVDTKGNHQKLVAMAKRAVTIRDNPLFQEKHNEAIEFCLSQIIELSKNDNHNELDFFLESYDSVLSLYLKELSTLKDPAR